jgi:hypothetical protein
MLRKLFIVHLRIPCLVFVLLIATSASYLAAQAPAAGGAKPVTPESTSASVKIKFDPAKFVKIYEDVGGKEILLYDPTLATSRQMKADANSVLIIKVDLASTPENTLISNLYMSAQLGGDKAVSVPVVGYSELGVSKETAGSQTAVSSQTVEDIRENVSTMYWTTREILERVYGTDCINRIAASPKTVLTEVACNPAAPSADFNTKVLDAFRLHKAEIETIAGALADPRQVEIARVIGNKVFGLSAATMVAAASDYRKDFDALTVGTTPNPAATTRLLERTKLILRDLCIDVDGCDDVSKVEAYLKKEQENVLAKLRTLVVDGQIFLSETKAKDGDTLKLRIESVSKGAGGGTAAAEFEISLRNYGVKAYLSPSIFFITRASVNDADLNRTVPGIDADGNPAVLKNPIKAVRGGPFPGMTFGMTAFHRGLRQVEREGLAPSTAKEKETLTSSTAMDKVRSALAPGIGVNVTFMNFADPRDFDPALNQFSSTSASNFQIGAGGVVSVFNSALQFTYGFNLNESQKSRYFGFGFGFIEIGKLLSGYLKK